MDQKNNKFKKTYSLDFKTKAAELAKSIGTRQAVEKLEIRNLWTLPLRNWKPAMNRFAIEYGERFEN